MKPPEELKTDTADEKAYAAMIERMTSVFKDDSYKSQERKQKLSQDFQMNLNAIKVVISGYSRLYKNMLDFGKQLINHKIENSIK